MSLNGFGQQSGANLDCPKPAAPKTARRVRERGRQRESESERQREGDLPKQSEMQDQWTTLCQKHLDLSDPKSLKPTTLTLKVSLGLGF